MKKSYRDLKVWEKAVDLTEAIYKITEKFPQREHYGLAAQTRKSAVSIASNIAEGSARHSDKEFQQFLIIARGSSAELHTQLLIATRMKFISQVDYTRLTGQLDEIGKMLEGLKRSLTVVTAKPALKLTTND